jgi:patatin-like phospholipase/acyl hydrolase
MAQSDYLILTFDGGGIRGLIPALLVQQLDQEFNFLRRVNLFAGTSTGGLLAIGLASEVPVAEIVDIYMTKGAEVFKRYGSLATAATQELVDIYPEAALLLPGLLHVKYTAEGLKNVVRRTFPTFDKTLGQLNRKLLLTAFDLYQGERKPWAPISLTNLPGYQTDDILVLDAALSTTAGPVYFPPHVFDHRGESKALIDGGVYANNPSMLAAASVMASGTLKEHGLAFENIKLLSLGTGFTVNSIPPENRLRPDLYGVLAWMFPFTKPPTPQFPLLEILMDGVSSIDAFQCEQIFGRNFRRANVTLTQPIAPDDYQKVGELVRMTEAYMASDEWQQIKDWIGHEFV